MSFLSVIDIVKELSMSHQYNLPQFTTGSSVVLIPNTTKAENAIEYINSYIDRTDSNKLSVDISHMNIIDACYVSTVCSAAHFIKFPNGKIDWLVSSEEVKKYTRDMSLGNSEYYSL